MIQNGGPRSGSENLSRIQGEEARITMLPLFRKCISMLNQMDRVLSTTQARSIPRTALGRRRKMVAWGT
jgi:hypothetical protein